MTGDVVGGTAGTTADGRSGVIEALSAGRITIDGSLIGGDFVDAMHTASNSGSISIRHDLRSLSIGEDVRGGTGRGSGNIFVVGSLHNVSIGDDFTGASSTADLKVVNSGYLQAANIGRLTIGGDLRAGADGGAGIDTSGAVRAQHAIGSVTIGGDFMGDATNPALITAVGQAQLSGKAKVDLAIGSVTVQGNVSRAAILAGYGTDTTNNLLGEPLNADASIGSVRIGGSAIALNIIAGVQAGMNGQFGDAGDARISGTGTIDRVDLVSRISSVIIAGTAAGSGVMGESFGIVAQHLVSVRANSADVALTPGASNDLAPGLVIDGSANFHALEVL